MAELTVDGMPSQRGSNDEAPAKGKPRQRILRGLCRISSSPSLSGPGRPKSAGNPNRNQRTFSCVSLETTSLSIFANNTNQPAIFRPSPLSMESASASTSASSDPPPSASAPCESPFMDVEEQKIEDEALSIREIELERLDSPSEFLDCLSEPESSELVHKSKLGSGSGFQCFDSLPSELQIYILSFLRPKDLVRTSIVSRSMYKLCFDGQLWSSLDASPFYKDIPAASLANMIVTAGPFIRRLNLRGCVQLEHYKRAESIVRSCKNLKSVTLEGCENLQKKTLHDLLESNNYLVHLNLRGLSAVTNMACDLLAASCPNLESLNVSWCKKVDASGLKMIVNACKHLKEFYAGEVRGFDCVQMAWSIFRTNRLEKLGLAGCADLTDEALRIMMMGFYPEIDVLTERPIVPPRKLRYLDLSRCLRLTSYGVKSIAFVTPDLEALLLARCKSLTDSALEPILASAPRLTHLELEDIGRLSSKLLSEHLVNGPCASRLEHLGLSYCERIGDNGVLPTMKQCVRLRRIDLDNTRITDSVLTEAVAMVKERSQRTTDPKTLPKKTLHMSIFDCPNVTWAGIRGILSHNAQMTPSDEDMEQMTYPTEMIGLKVFYTFQLTVNEHQKRVLRGDFAAADRLEGKWANYMEASEEAGADGIGFRRRHLRRIREAQTAHQNEAQVGGGAAGGGALPPRARTLGPCVVM